MKINDRVHKQGGTFFLGELPMEWAYRVLTPVGKFAAAWHLSPNIFSAACLILGIFAGIVIAFGHVGTAGALSIVSSLFDTLDGIVARTQGRASDAGEVLDAAVDRYTEFFFLGGLCIYYRFEPIAMVLVLTALMGSYLVSYSQAKAEAMHVEVPKLWMRRPERALYLGLGAFLSPLFTMWWEGVERHPLHYLLLAAVMIVGIFANVTALRRFVVLYKKLKPVATNRA